MAHFLTLTPVDTLLALVQSFPPCAAETVPLENAFGRTLAEAFCASENLPGFDRSTMDGFAVHARDVFGASEGIPALMALVAECPMGTAPDVILQPGQTARIWTGGMLPEGADAVVMLEYARQADATTIELTRPVAPGDHVILHDEDATKGQELIPAGRVLRPQEIGLLAALGQQEVLVRRKPRVAVISSGDEVIPVAQTPCLGQVRDVNSYTLVALAQAAGAEARSLGIARDNQEQLHELVASAAQWADIVLLSGGSSAGQRDYTLAALEALPDTEIVAHGVAISPGKPLIFARQGQKSLWGLPGHAASALVCAEVFIRPLLARLLGQPAERPVWAKELRAELTRSVASAQGRRDYIRVALAPPREEGAPMQAVPVMGKSGLISTLVVAQALVICPEDLEGLSAGQIVSVHLLA